MATEGYNGWTNYPTWCVNLWLSNDEPLYREALGMAQETIEEDESTSQYWTLDESRRFGLADRFKSWVRDDLVPDLVPDLGASFVADLLGFALDEVDWEEIAVSWLESVADRV